MFSKVLVANRGEIALRIIRTCREMGIRTVVIYSDADKDSLHVKYADEAVNIGAPLARKSYLNVENIIEEVKKTRAEAVHPGYGFLAENALFAEACEDNGINFVGPPSRVHKLAGDKIESRKRADKVEVPVLPGSDDDVTEGEAIKLAKQIGYPLMIKASGGGGGKGMKIVSNKNELAEFLKLSRGEAIAAFKNPALYLEKYLVEPRHVEFQILGDQFGNYVHLGERECSIQRRFQKLIEESPPTLLDEETRRNMGKAAIDIACAVGYTNAGTVEFLMDKDRNFYFNEINSHLQVEHPVTEMVTGVDLVKQQLMIAAGERLEFSQDNMAQNGWAIECRINAEDPDNEFKPSPRMVKQIIVNCITYCKFPSPAGNA